MLTANTAYGPPGLPSLQNQYVEIVALEAEPVPPLRRHWP